MATTQEFHRLLLQLGERCQRLIDLDEREVAKELAQLAHTFTETRGKLRAKERERDAFPEPQIAQLKGHSASGGVPLCSLRKPTRSLL